MLLAHDLAIALDPARLMESASLQPDDWQRAVLRSAAKRILLLCTRQAGKSTVTAALALHEAMFKSGALILLLSPSLRQSVELFRKLLDFYRRLNVDITAQESALRLELTNGSRVISLPATEGTVRGYSGADLLVIDEASRVDDALYFGVRPMLAVSNGRLIALTTPFGKRGFFFTEWTKGQGWEKVRITAEQCPRISKEFLEEERRSLGDWWYRQEYLCEFVDSVDSVFLTEHVMAALSDSVKPLFDEE